MCSELSDPGCSSDEPGTNAESLDLFQRFERNLANYNPSQHTLERWLFDPLCWLISAIFLCVLVGT
jgi:hypothetical protein